MGYQFDELAKALAVETSRRRALQRIVLALLGGFGLALVDRRSTDVVQAAVALKPIAPLTPRQRPIFNQICFNQVIFNQTCPEEETPSNGGENKPDSTKPLTSTERFQHQRTNTSSQEDERIEGNVVGVNPDGRPPTITIANVDGNVVVERRGDALALANSVRAATTSRHSVRSSTSCRSGPLICT